MHRLLAAAAVLAALPAIAPRAHAQHSGRELSGRRSRRRARAAAAVDAIHTRDRLFGFYGNVWCQPPNEQSYMRNLGSRWPMETPPSLKYPKPTTNNSDW